MKKIFPIFILTVLFMYACGEKKKEASEMLYDQVMAVHDEIMPKMGDIMKYKKQLRQKAELLSAEADSAQVAAINKAISGLDKAHDEMMGWMHEFDPNFDKGTQEEIMKYLNNQKEKIEKVGSVTNEAIQNAIELLGQ